jgi:signal transduction histidine kinase
MRETLTEMMIHDLRSPLSGIYTAVDALLSEGDMEREVQREMLWVAQRSAERMLRMVETLIDIARLEAGRMPPDLAAWADPELLERVIVNLTGNAIKFTPRGGDVVIRGCKESDGGVLLSVQDTGSGIPLEDQARIFDRFTQAGQRRQWGSGLGLTFCKMTVDAHGGRIWVESAPGEGSTFYVRLPLSHTHASETVRMKGTKTGGDQL